MRKLKALMCCLFAVILVFVSVLILFPTNEKTKYPPSLKAEYTDYLNGYDITLEGTVYFEKSFDKGWYVDYPKGDTVFVYGDWVLLYDKAYFLEENNKKKFGIVIEESSGTDIYVFPSDIQYPDFRYDAPDRIDIFTDNNAMTLGARKILTKIKPLEEYIREIKEKTQIRKITKEIYDSSVYDLLPEEIQNDKQSSIIKIRLHWDKYPYYFEQILTKSADGEFVPEITRPD